MRHENYEQRKHSICFDQGNSATKAGVFFSDKLVEVISFENSDLSGFENILRKYPSSNCILSSVIETEDSIISRIRQLTAYFLLLSEKTLIPVTNNYNTPATLGKDRLAAIVGANALMPTKDILVIDAGTAITYDFIDSVGVYHGGNIAPGVDMRLKALHQFTRKLPLVEAFIETPLMGTDTATAINSGVINGIEFEIHGYINTLKIKYPELLIFLTGGSSIYFEEKFKNAIFVEKNLVLIGLNRILLYNVQE